MKSTGTAAPTKPGGTRRKKGRLRKCLGQDLWCRLARRGEARDSRENWQNQRQLVISESTRRWRGPWLGKQKRDDHAASYQRVPWVVQRLRLAGDGVAILPLDFEF